MTSPGISVAAGLPRRALRTHSPARRHATAGAQRPPSSLQEGRPVKLARLSTNACARHPRRGNARALPTLSTRPSHTPSSPRPPLPTEPQERRNSLLTPCSSLARDLGKARGGRDGSGDTTNMAATAAKLTNAEAVAAAAVAAVKKAVGIPRCSCQEVSNGRSDSTAALRLRVAR